MKNILKMFSLMLMVLLMMSSCGSYSTNTTSGPQISVNENLKFKLNSRKNGYILFDYVGDDVEIFVPDQYKGLPVLEIEEGAFSDCKTIQKITLPFIGASANNHKNEKDLFGYIFGKDFYEYGLRIEQYCSDGQSLLSHEFYIPDSLDEVVVSNRAERINDYAFSGCSFLTSIEIQNSATRIGSDVFLGCDSLEKLTLPNLDTYLGDYFGAKSSEENSKYVPSSLKEVVITGGTNIQDCAFESCSSLTSISIPNSVTSIGNSAFDNCISLQYNEYENCLYLGNVENPYLVLVKAKDTSITEVIVSNNTRLIMHMAFYGCKSLTSIAIPDSVTNLGSNLFLECNSLESVKLPYLDTYIGYYFGAKSVEENSEYIPSCLDEVAITGGTNIPQNAFLGCDSLEKLTLPYLDTYLGYYFGAKSAGENANYVPKSLKEVIFIRGTDIPNYAFEDCKDLTTIVLPNCITSIGRWAFRDCRFSSINIPNSVISIEDAAFYNCSSLTSIVIPNSVINFGNNVFEGCSSLQYNEYGNCLYLGNEENPFLVLVKAKDTAISSATISNNTRFILGAAFKDCISLTSITIPNSVTDIAYSAFYNCSKLTTVTFKGKSKLTNIGPDVFKGCISLISITIPSSVTTIGDTAFYGCSSLTSIVLPNSITSIGVRVFECCKSLKYNEYGNCLYLGNKENPYLVLIRARDIYITSATISNKTKIIMNTFGIYYRGEIGENYAFEKCESLTTIVIPKNVVHIGNNAFSGCSSLTSIVISDGVTSIGEWAFSGCSSLDTIVIPISVTSIGRYAFISCSSITIYCEAKSKPIEWKGSWNFLRDDSSMYQTPVYWADEWSYVNNVPTPNK